LTFIRFHPLGESTEAQSEGLDREIDPRRQLSLSEDAIDAHLAALFSRSVDLVMPKAVRNPYIRSAIDRDRQLVYAP
jgi:hypothetical protein